MRPQSLGIFRVCFLAAGLLIFCNSSWAHVTLRPSQPLRPGSSANFIMNVPSERGSDTVSVSLEVPEAFLKAGGRLSRVEYPPGWQVVIEKEDKPAQIYSQEMAERSRRNQGSEGSALSAITSANEKEDELLNEMRKQWIKKVTFKAGSIPPDGFKEFLLSFQLPDTPGAYRFPAVQLYGDGTEVSWTELVEGAQYPAPSIVLEKGQAGSTTQDLPLALSAFAFAIAAALAVERFRRGKS
jgi:uncharacterized protein YcnI